MIQTLDEALVQFDAEVLTLIPTSQRTTFKALREQRRVVEAEALATKNEECAKAIESLAQALRSQYARHDIEDAMQAVSKAYAAALVVDPKDAA